MTKEEFDNYQFSVGTRIKYGRTWLELFSVDFEKRTVTTENSEIHYSDIDDIKEV